METKNLPVTSATSKKKEVKIFIVDDDPIYNHALEHKLRKCPENKVYSFKTGEECFRAMSSLEPDIVILDYRLNDSNPRAMNGLEILKRMKVSKPEISVLMLSGQENFEVVSNSIRYGAFDYVPKNEGAFVKLEHLIDKILDQNRLQKISRVQKNYFSLLITLGILTILLPVVLYSFMPEKISWLILGLFISFFTFFGIVNQTIFANKKV